MANDKSNCVGFEVIMKSSIFWDITPCSLLEVNQRLSETYHLRKHTRPKFRLVFNALLAAVPQTTELFKSLIQGI
jgi:hypothetical protein